MTDYPDLIQQSQEIWEHNARWWDDRMGEGNEWHRVLIAPAVEKLLAIQSGERVLELACGNGQFARRLASLGAHVVACDFSPGMLECARQRPCEHVDRIDYRLVDLTREEDLASLDPGQFDAAVCNMAMMDIACITPLLGGVRDALRPRGRFVFAVPHPCFNTNGTTMIAERDDFDGPDGSVSFSVRVKRYRTLEPQQAIGIPGQPRPHFYFHRPLHVLLGACFAAGFALDGLEEPAFEGLSVRGVSWDNCSEIPPILAARLRV